MPRLNRARRHLRLLTSINWKYYAGASVLTAHTFATHPIATSTTAIAITGSAVLITKTKPTSLTRTARRIQALNNRRPALPRNGHRTLETFQRMNPERFEKAIAELAATDPHVISATRVGGANDRGMDVRVHLHDGRRILIQCKRYRHGNNVGSDIIQTINGVYRELHHCHEAVIITTAKFTRSAFATNAALPHPIRLIDGDSLTAWANGAPAPWR
jgi:restriction system protein